MIEGITDIHCHILPEVDDGAADMKEAVQLLQMEYGQGVRRVILTPHYRANYFETPRRKVEEVFEKLQRQVGDAGMDMQLFLGCEFHRQMDMIEKLNDATLRMAGTRYVLLEFAGLDTMDSIRYYTTQLMIHGFRPVIAHAERYRALQEIKNVRFLAESGVYIQVNAESICGAAGWSMKRYCARLLKTGNIHFVGSDAHNVSMRPPLMGKCAAYLKKKVGVPAAEKILIENPSKLIANEYI